MKKIIFVLLSYSFAYSQFEFTVVLDGKSEQITCSNLPISVFENNDYNQKIETYIKIDETHLYYYSVSSTMGIISIISERKISLSSILKPKIEDIKDDYFSATYVLQLKDKIELKQRNITNNSIVEFVNNDAIILYADQLKLLKPYIENLTNLIP